MKQIDGTLNQSGFLFLFSRTESIRQSETTTGQAGVHRGMGVVQREGLLARWPDSHAAHLFVITRRGRGIRTRGDAETYKRAKLLPDDSLYPILARKVAPQFLRGNYDTAVFQAFKEVEV